MNERLESGEAKDRGDRDGDESAGEEERKNKGRKRKKNKQTTESVTGIAPLLRKGGGPELGGLGLDYLDVMEGQFRDGALN